MPRGWPQPHLPLIAKYDLNAWPPANLDQLRKAHGVSVEGGEEREEQFSRGSSGRRSRAERGERGERKRKRRSDEDARGSVRERVGVSAGSHHPSLKKQKLPNSSHSPSKLDRSMSIDAGLVMNRGSSLLGTPPFHRAYDVPGPPPLLSNPATPPLGQMLPPLISLSSPSERRGEKRPLLDHHHRHRRDSEPIATKQPKLSHQGDFPREPLHTTPTHSHSNHERNERFSYHHHHHGNHHEHQSHSSRHYDDHHRRISSPNTNHYPMDHRIDINNTRALITSRRMSYNEDRGAYHGSPPMPPHSNHRRLSDYSDLASGNRSPSVSHDIDSRHKRHRTEDGLMVNSRGFRGQTNLMRNNYRH